MPGSAITLDRACELARTGDLWLFRGRSGADRAIRSLTNAPVNHVGMALVVEDLPPLMWHAELGRSLPDVWSGTHQRGVQLHDLRAAVLQWGHRYGQRGWLRQLSGPVSREMEDAALRTVARLDGTPFPSTVRLAGRWLRGRAPRLRLPTALPISLPIPLPIPLRRPDGDAPAPEGADRRDRALETAYCAEVVALTYQEMGLLTEGRRPSWYDPGRFWSGDELGLAEGFALGGEVEVVLPPGPRADAGG
ncbi:hypothetical protein [Pseudonocardia humida]|uniref:Guanylate cyclase n=1 Tax=Pseudonocardia humida TaxID=2800819 RepID=A0ABT0ZS00_9PSEU|nr:hypothetical protein [Pseudonocardia humida]MCO1653501.1 hypothetical protein [Pseudonocardia humida]